MDRLLSEYLCLPSKMYPKSWVSLHYQSEYVCIRSHYAMKLMSTSEIQLWTEHPITSHINLHSTK
jgi:hypothetical protein